MARLSASKVAIFGIGGVGSFAAEALARTGIGSFVLVDDDCVCLTNLNRQLIALRSTVGKPKVEVMRNRILDINPAAKVEIIQEFYSAESSPRILSSDLSYVVDAIDTVSSKIDLILRCKELGVPIVSSMGAGNKLDPTRFHLADIYETSICPLARVMRRELRKRDVRELPVVYSTEEPIAVDEEENPCRTECVCPKKDRTCVGRRSVPGSVSFVPSVAGLILASKVVADLSDPLFLGLRPRSFPSQDAPQALRELGPGAG